MANIEPLAHGSEKLKEIFGYWPTFHDAEVLDLHFWRGNIDTSRDLYDFPVLTLKIHLWQLTKEVDPKGYLVCKHQPPKRNDGTRVEQPRTGETSLALLCRAINPGVRD